MQSEHVLGTTNLIVVAVVVINEQQPTTEQHGQKKTVNKQAKINECPRLCTPISRSVCVRVDDMFIMCVIVRIYRHLVQYLCVRFCVCMLCVCANNMCRFFFLYQCILLVLY